MISQPRYSAIPHRWVYIIDESTYRAQNVKRRLFAKSSSFDMFAIRQSDALMKQSLFGIQANLTQK